MASHSQMKESSSHPQAPPTSTTDAVEKSQAAESDGYKRAPTSFSQRRLWLLDRLLPSRTVYNLRTTRRLVGELDVDALRRALNEVLRRHEALRTRFAVIDGEPVQEIVPQLLLPLVPEDLGDLTALERESEARRRVEDEAQTDFDLQQGPLFRARLLRLSPTEHWLLLTMHHIVTDVWSHSVLVREISTLYAAFRLGEPSPLPEPRMQYADFATWQRQWLQGETLTRQLDYWRIALADLPVLELPTDRARPAVPSYRGGRVTFAIDAARTLALKGLARAE
ncbi:MAG TPA: condensation domain-containing protein, partial [Actinomycetota bacterium]|nr:condensation domain-containing protein [Actinomycetota bacterium]